MRQQPQFTKENTAHLCAITTEQFLLPLQLGLRLEGKKKQLSQMNNLANTKCTFNAHDAGVHFSTPPGRLVFSSSSVFVTGSLVTCCIQALRVKFLPFKAAPHPRGCSLGAWLLPRKIPHPLRGQRALGTSCVARVDRSEERGRGTLLIAILCVGW